MEWLDYVAYFFGGLFLANSIPHLVAGMQGRSFPSPFAKPPGKGLSSPTVNVAWGSFNVLAAYLLILKVGAFDLRNPFEATAVALGALAVTFHLAYHFGKLFGGSYKA